MQFNFPISLVYEDKGRNEFNTWIEELVTNFEVFHGYAGLSIQLPYDHHPYKFYEYRVTRQYWGITPDGASFLKRDWYEGIRSINWYKPIGRDLKDQFINQPFYEATLKNSSEIKIKEINNSLVIKADEFPRLGNKRFALQLYCRESVV
ncbi:type VI immunity family protein [Acinetobacter haemolyticus]|uniref:type VI immunity family protein n=1 Tax=Acinetobacter haemolyticus TaxID=29430 RepID=UPI001FB8F4E8|nr:type VI immunity family protein [Acinetobacter haemolyticus]